MKTPINLHIPLDSDDDGDIDEDMLKAGVEDSIIGAVKTMSIRRIHSRYNVVFNISPLIFFNNTTTNTLVHCTMECPKNTKSCAKEMINDLKQHSNQYNYSMLLEIDGHLSHASNGAAYMDVSSIAPSSISGKTMHRITHKGLFFDKKTSGSHYKELFYNDITHLFNVSIVPQVADGLVKDKRLSLLDRVILRNLVPEDIHNTDMILTSYPLIYSYANSSIVYHIAHKHFSMAQVQLAYKYLINHAAIIQISTIDIAHRYAKPLLAKQASFRIY